jgi:hypothetical protein
MLIDQPDRYHAQRSDMMRMPDPFLEKLMGMDGPSQVLPFQGLSDGIAYGRSHGRGDVYMPKKMKNEKIRGTDRRLPMVHCIQGAGSAHTNIPFSELEPKKREFIGWEDVQYLGENMVC